MRIESPFFMIEMIISALSVTVCEVIAINLDLDIDPKSNVNMSIECLYNNILAI